MSARPPNYGFQSPTMVQPANGGHACLFSATASENELSEEDGETYELRPRGKERYRRSTSREKMDDIIYLNRDIHEGDTLNSIALQYHCSVTDLKRSNSLVAEQDFFALRSVKIPVKRFSMLTETYNSGPLKQASPGESRRPNPSYSADLHPPELSTDSSSSTDSVEGYLQVKDKDIEQLVKSSEPSRSNLHEVVSSLTAQPVLPSPGKVEYKPAEKKDPYYGADWGMRWWTAVVIMLVVGIITPVFYLLYYEVLMKGEVGHHGTDVDIPSLVLAAHEHVPLENHQVGTYPSHHAAGVPQEAPQGLKVDSPPHAKT
ncbi:lysM and putative peptidoglycan-binding domain-containing protein 3 [Stigmatopora argus]